MAGVLKPSPGALRIIDDLEEGLAIVVNGNTAPKNIAAGQYLFIKNHSTLATGGYHATAAISSGGTISSSNVAADADGIANSLNSKVDQNKNWTLINDVQENTPKTIDSRYNEVFANCALSSGNHICFHVIKPTSGETRQDTGYYFTNTANGSGVITYNASDIINILHPYQNGIQTTYSSIQVYAR